MQKIEDKLINIINGTEELFERTTVKIKDDLHYFNLSTVELWDSMEKKCKPTLKIHHEVNLSDDSSYYQIYYDREIINIEDAYLVVRKKNKTLEYVN